MPTRRPGEVRRIAPLAIIALAATLFLVGAGVTGSRERVLESEATAWRGLVGGIRPPVAVGQRMIVVLSAPSLADRVAEAGGRASDDQERRWTAAALAAQKGLLSTLAAHGVKVRVDFNYTRVLNGFSAALDPQAASLLERQPDVAGVYPVRVAYPASLSSKLVPRGLARGAADQPQILLPGYDGRGVTIALLDTGVDRAHAFLRGRILDGIDLLGDDYGALAKPKADDSTQLERHGTEMAGLLVGAGGPAGVTGVATGAAVLPIRVAGWQRDLTGGTSVYARSDQLIAGLERAVDPNEDGDAHDAARIALVALAAPYAAFTDGPDALAVRGALRLDTLVVAPAGNDGPAAAGFGSISSPGGAPDALTVAAADLRRQTQELRVVVRSGLGVLLDRMVPLAGAVVPERANELELATPSDGAPGDSSGVNGFRTPPALDDFFDDRGLSKVAGRAALVPAADDPQTAVVNAVRAGATAVVLYGGALPPGGLGLDESVPVPVVSISEGAAVRALDALDRGRRVAVALGRPRVAGNGSERSIAPFSSHGLAFDGRVKPDLAAPGVGLMTSDPGENEDGSPRYATVSGSSAAAATVAGAAALLAQTRPSLEATEIRGLLAGYARPFGDQSVRSQGTGLVDVGAAAAAEIVASPVDLAFGRAAHADWRSDQVVTVKNLSTRALRFVVKTPEAGAAGLRISTGRRRVFLWPGESKRVRLRAAFRGAPAGEGETAEGVIAFDHSGSTPLRIPWAITFGQPPSNLLSALRLSASRFSPSDTAPAVLAFQAGRVVATSEGSAVQPVERLDVELARSDGTSLGMLVRLRDLLPGRYAFGLTGRDPDGNVLPTGDYELRLVAASPEGGAPTRRTVPFAIE